MFGKCVGQRFAKCLPNLCQLFMPNVYAKCFCMFSTICCVCHTLSNAYPQVPLSSTCYHHCYQLPPQSAKK